MKICLLNDSHFGIRSDSPVFRDYFNKFFDQIFFPYLEANNIKKVVHLGDFLDRRKYVNFETLKSSISVLDKFKEKDIDLHILVGNHDTYYKNTSTLNSLDLLFKDRCKVYTDFCDIIIDNKSFAIIPWINDENYDKFQMFLSQTKSKVAFGHFELNGFQVMRGVKCDHGLDPATISQFDRIYSGHFHQKHDDGRIFYLGTQYDMTFADVDETKGFHVLDTDTLDLKFIPNPYKLFYKIQYKDDLKIDHLDLRDCFAKIIVTSKPSQLKFEQFLEEVYAQHPHDISIVEEYELFQTETKIDETKDTVSIICDEIDGMEYDSKDKETIKSIIAELYLTSQNVDDTDKEEE